jgi:hypothetical protein
MYESRSQVIADVEKHLSMSNFDDVKYIYEMQKLLHD